MFAMKTTLDIPDTLYREFKAKTATTRERPACTSRRTRPRLPEWAGMAVPFIKKYPDDPLDSEKMRDEIVAARREGLS